MKAHVAECRSCRLAYQTPRPPLEASIAYMDMRWQSGDTYVADIDHQRERSIRQLAYVRQLVTSQGRLLDFGAGAGAFVQQARDMGWDAEGAEHSPAAREKASSQHGVHLHESLPDGPFDVITLWDVIEHLRDPIGIVRVLSDQLNSGGWLFIETGNWECWDRLCDGDAWGLYLFDHQYYFSPNSLQQTLARTGLAEFHLLKEPRGYPHPLRSRATLRHPVTSIRQWWCYRQAMRQWPGHGNRSLLIAAAQKPL
jgi:SAM-dependent methyltransferase